MATPKSKPKPKPKPKLDVEFTKLLGNQLLNAKGFYEYGIERGLVTPEALRLTVAKRQETSKALVASGMSQRQAAKALGVDQKTVSNDVRNNSSKTRNNSSAGSASKSTGRKPLKPSEDEACIDNRKHLLNLASKAETAGYNSMDPKTALFDLEPLIEAAKEVIAVWQRVVIQYEGLTK